MPKTLLLADDSVVIQKLVALSFANEDVKLVTVYNGDEAIAKARACRPDAVLADVVMPGKNGYEVCEAIRQDPQLAHVPVLLLTGTFEAFDEDRASRAGSNGHITKPFEAQALVDRVNELLASAATAPVAAAPDASGEKTTTAKADEAYDFFDDEMPASVADEAPAAVDARSDDVFGFGDDDVPDLEPLSEEDADDLDLDLDGERTVAMTGEAPSFDSDPLIGMSESGASARDAAGNMTVTVSGLRDEESGDVSFSSRVTSPEVAIDSSRGASDDDSDLEFSFDGGTASSQEVPPELDLASDAGAAPPLPEAELDPEGSSAYDVSISDLGDSFSLDVAAARATTTHEDAMAMPPPLPIRPAKMANDSTASFGTATALTSPADTADDHAWPVEETPAPDLPGDAIDPFEDSFAPASGVALEADLDSDLADSSDDLDPVFGGAALVDEDEPEDRFAAALEARPIPATAAGAHLSDVMRDRVHETLEKVAWEAFADLSDTIVRQVLERVEQVAWEVIPQMAEALIQDEIRKIKGDDDA
jgi:CheY-like chemotaxis protein